MDLKPTKGLKVTANATKEAIFGEEAIDIRKATFPNEKSRVGMLTGTTLAGYCEVEMPSLDGKKHWYPVGELEGERGEKIVEEEIEIEMPEDDDPGDE